MRYKPRDEVRSPRWILAVIVLSTLILMGFASGCGNPSFVRYAMSDAQGSLVQARTGVEECRRDLATDRARESEIQWKAYLADQADTVAKAVAEKPTPEALKAALAQLAATFQSRLDIIEANREKTDTRFVRVEQHLDYMALIFARLDALARAEESVQAQLAEYQLLAEQIARQKFGLPAALPAVGEPVLAAPISSEVTP